MKPNLSHSFALVAAGLLLLTGCSTAQKSSQTTAAFGGSAVHARTPAAVDEPLIEKFVDALTGRSTLGSQEAVEDAITQVVNDNSTKLSISKIDSLDDIAAMSDADQRRIVDELATLPELSDKLALDSEAVDVARGEAIAAQDVKGVATETVPDLQKGGATSTTAPTFAKFLSRAPEMKNDVTLMLKADADIQQKTGTEVLGKDCDSLQNTESVENLATIITGVDRDVAAGQASDAPTVVKSFENNAEYVLGTDAKEAHDRICVLADTNQCGVISPKMCE